MAKDDKQKEIEALEEQAKKAESKGLFDTSHHEMLRRLKGEKPKQPKAQEQPKGELNNG